MTVVSPGVVRAIHIAPESGVPMRSLEEVEAVAGRGLRGDRYFDEKGTYSASARSTPRDLTLIESETLEALKREAGIEIPTGAHRRNVTTRGIELDPLVDEEFAVGTAVCVGVELCEPCSYLERLLEIEGLHDALVHRGGIRARIIDSGEISVGDGMSVRRR